MNGNDFDRASIVESTHPANVEDNHGSIYPFSVDLADEWNANSTPASRDTETIVGSEINSLPSFGGNSGPNHVQSNLGYDNDAATNPPSDIVNSHANIMGEDLFLPNLDPSVLWQGDTNQNQHAINTNDATTGTNEEGSGGFMIQGSIPTNHPPPVQTHSYPMIPVFSRSVAHDGRRSEDYHKRKRTTLTPHDKHYLLHFCNDYQLKNRKSKIKTIANLLFRHHRKYLDNPKMSKQTIYDALNRYRSQRQMVYNKTRN